MKVNNEVHYTMFASEFSLQQVLCMVLKFTPSRHYSAARDWP